MQDGLFIPGRWGSAHLSYVLLSMQINNTKKAQALKTV